MHEYFVCMYLCAHVHTLPAGARKGSPRNGVTDGHELPDGFWEPHSGPL